MAIAGASAASPCSEYNALLPKVTKVRDFIDGAVGGYIHKLGGHTQDDYELYVKLAYYLPSVSRTLDAYTGLVMTPEPIVSEANEAFQPFLDDLTNEGEPFQRVAFRAVEEVIASGRYCVLVDYPNNKGAADISKLEAERLGMRPFARCYKWEDILDWRTTMVAGRKVLSHLRLRESVDEPGLSEWETRTRQQVRVLDLFEGAYRVRVYRAVTPATKEDRMLAATPIEAMVQEGDDFYPTMAGKRMQAIPAIIFGPNSLDPSLIERPPLYEMCGVSQSHLNDSALRQWALMWCGNPTLVISGLLSDPGNDAPIRFGSSEGIVLGEGGAAEIVSLGSDGVGALKESMEEKRRDMAAIGARILADESGAQISTETARIQRAGEHSVLAGISNTVADGLTQVLRIMAEWAGVSIPKVAVTLNTDFLPNGLQTGELTEWLAGLQNGSLPLSVVLEHLKSRGVVDPQMSPEDWKDEIGADADTLGFDQAGKDEAAQLAAAEAAKVADAKSKPETV